MHRFAKVNITLSDTAETVKRYLPDNYVVIYEGNDIDNEYVIIMGEDVAGWTLDDYVLPRLASGMIFGKELKSD